MINTDQNKILKMAENMDKMSIHANLPIVEELQTISETLKTIAEKEIPEQKPLDKIKVQIDGVEVITLKGDKGDPGQKGQDGTIGQNGKDGRDGKDGKNGKDAPIPDIPAIVSQASAMTEERLKPFIPKIEDIENDLPKLGTAIRDSLELLPDGEKLTIESIENLRKELDALKKMKSTSGGGGGIVGRDLIKDIDISAQLNGVLTTFNIQSVWNVVSVSLSSFPYALRKNVDFSWTPSSVTFLSTIDPSTQLSSGQTCILTVVQG